jgi:ligand-binding SRPBCC domain-containing protein
MTANAICRMTETGSNTTHVLRREQFVPARLDRIFGFFSNPYNLSLITPPRLHFRVVTPNPLVMRAGLTIDYRLRLAGLPLHWRSLISTFDPPYCFVDEQLVGPYASWRHTHRFEQVGQGTLLKDEVVYALPQEIPALFKKLVHSSYVEPYLKEIFDFRACFYRSFFTASCGQTQVNPLPCNTETPS